MIKKQRLLNNQEVILLNNKFIIQSELNKMEEKKWKTKVEKVIVEEPLWYFCF